MIVKGFIVAASAALFATTEPTQPTIENVEQAILDAGIQETEIVLRQAIYETKWFSCTDCSLDGNNLFGFRLNHQYIKFQCWGDAVNYYKAWQDKYYNGEDYYQFLINIGYARSESYTTDLQSLNIPGY